MKLMIKMSFCFLGRFLGGFSSSTYGASKLFSMRYRFLGVPLQKVPLGTSHGLIHRQLLPPLLSLAQILQPGGV